MKRIKNNIIFGFDYSTWVETCKMYFNLKSQSSFKMYIQQYPFCNLTTAEITEIKSEDFYNKNIAEGRLFFNDSLLMKTKNYITKNSGSFRDSNLISPFLFLVIQAIGLEIYKRYIPVRSQNKNISVFYSGNFEAEEPLYKNQYKRFSNLNTHYFDKGYDYFIKTDLSDYFSNINIDKLLDFIRKHSNKKFTPLQQKSISDLLLYAGDGKFPLVQNSITSSYLATVVYLDEIDKELGNYIYDLIGNNYKMVRYVDDLYIWIKSDNLLNINDVYNDIRAQYCSLLHKYGLMMNTSKTALYKGEKINEKLKSSIYKDVFESDFNKVDDIINEQNWKQIIVKFINELEQKNNNGLLTKDSFEELVTTYFKPESVIEYTGDEILKYIIYDKNMYLKDSTIIDKIHNAIDNGISFMYLSPQLLTNMILNTRSGTSKNLAIKSMLNQLFIKSGKNTQNSYDIDIALHYLLRTNFSHQDLITKVIKPKDMELYNYIINFCKNSFLETLKLSNKDKYLLVINKDWKTYYLYLNYKIEKDRKRYLESFSFYKTYFDRITACIAADISKGTIKPKDFYKDKALSSVYEGLDTANSKKIRKVIKKANELRNKNPLVHSDSALLGQPDWSDSIKKVITDLENLINKGIESYR